MTLILIAKCFNMTITTDQTYFKKDGLRNPKRPVCLNKKPRFINSHKAITILKSRSYFII